MGGHELQNFKYLNTNTGILERIVKNSNLGLDIQEWV